MNFLHVKIGHVSRSTGRSCVQSVAYATKEKLYEDRRGLTADYRDSEQEVSWETMAPTCSGIGKKDLSFWNKLDAYEDEYAEKRYKTSESIARYKTTARTAQTYVLALPKELSQLQNVDLLREFVQERFVDKGLMATWAIHWEEGNPHAHVNVSTRTVWNGEISWTKQASRELDGTLGIRETRKIYANLINKYQEMLGIIDRVDPLSFAERGIELIPTQHKGYKAHQLERDGLFSRIGKDNEHISEANKERIAAEPGIIIKELTSTQATFSEMDVIRLMQKRLKDDIGILGDHVLHGVMKDAVEVGTGMDNSQRYTSQEYFDKEARILESFEDYQANKTTIKIDSSKVDELLSRLVEQGKEQEFVPNEGQINGIKTLCGDAQLSVLIGRAGTGKTTTMSAVVQLHKAAGFDVIGMAPSATAASQLEADTGCKSDTIAHYAYYWNKYDEAVELLHAASTDKEMNEAQKAIHKYKEHLPTSDTLIIIDEAGMVGVGDRKGSIPGGWDAITRIIDSTGAKLILTGDDHQFKPIEAGDVFRKFVYLLREAAQQGVDLRLCELTEIKRQTVDWMREASGHLAELNVATALGMYENRGHIKEHASNEEVYKDIAQQYLQHVIKQPDSTGIVIAATNEERLALNKEIRSLLKDNGLLAKEDLFQHGENGYTVGDKIVFTKNDRGWNTKFKSEKEGFFVQNSMQAVIHSIKPLRRVDEETGEVNQTSQIVANTFDDKGKITATIQFNLDEYKHFTPGYAVTGWKSQGNTLDWVIAKLSKYMDAHGLYVIATRHREEISMHYSKEDFADYKALVHSLSRANVKDLVVDYSVSDENKEYWQNVQDYKETGRELQGIRALARSLDKENKEALKAVWENYREVEGDRKSWAKFILGDWDVHKDFTRQAGLTKESLEIAAGLKKRSMSRVEIEAQQTVEQYVAVSLEARELWRDIRKTHPGSRAKLHSEWPKFVEARDQRGVLANTIHINPILHRPFLKETAENLAKEDIGYVAKNQNVSSDTSVYSMATIKVQAATHQTKMLQDQLLKDNSKPAQQDMLKHLISYTESRDMAGAIWQELRPKLKEFEGTLLKESFSTAISEYTEIRIKRDAAASQIMERQEAFAELTGKVGMKLDFEKLGEQAIQATRDRLLEVYQTSPEEMAKLEAACELNAMAKSEAELEGKKLTISQVYQQGLQPKDISRDALEYQKLKLFEGLKTEPEQALFLLLDEYDSKCRTANQIYGQCIEETKGKDKNAWESSHYPAYKAACNSRNDVALEVFDQRDHNEVLSMAEAMGMGFKETELQEIFSRCEQTTRTNNIISYNTTTDAEAKGKAAVTLRQMIEFERREADSYSKTAQQAYHAGIDLKELQQTALVYGRAEVKQHLTTRQDIELFHTLTTYEKFSLEVNKAYKECLEESKQRSPSSLEIKPWETEKYKDYISLVAVQDEKAYQLIKGHRLDSVSKIAKEMGISVKKLDVEAHRHSLRQTLQTFTEGDRTNVPMAAKDILNWLEFDRHSDHKHTFKVLREQDLWPKDLQKALDGFFDKKRELRHEEQRELKNSGQSKVQGRGLTPEYQTVTYERYQSFEEVDKQLKERMFELATDVLGNPTSRTSNQLRFGNKGSICVFTNGPKQGLYANHETGVYGGPLKLIEEQIGLSSSKDSLKWASEWLGGNPLVIEQRVVEKQRAEVKVSTWTPVTPIPKAEENPDIEGNKYLNYRLKDGYTEVARYAYRDEQGNLKGYVFRFEKPNAEDPNGKNSKITPPLAYCENEKGFKAWRWQGFFGDQKTAYGLEKLVQDATKPVLIVEGEKKADVAQKMLPEFHVLSWIGGAGSVGKTDWGCLGGREVVIWPDNDSGGLKAADTLQKIVSSINLEKGLNGSVGVVSLPSELPKKWDLADQLPEGWTIDTIKEMIKGAIPQKQIEMVKNQPVIVTEPLPPSLKTYNFVERQTLAYLKQEIQIEKHEWLDESDVKHLINMATLDPKEALKEWQYVTEDYSFDPYKFNSALADNMNSKDEELFTLNYLKQEIVVEKHQWLTKEDCENLLEEAEKDPIKTLYKWQSITDDYSFIAGGIESLSSDQLKAYEMLQAVKTNISSEKLNEWHRILKDAPKEVIENCQPILGQKQSRSDESTYQAKLNVACQRYIDISERHQSLSWNDPQKENLDRTLKEISGKYLHDEKFVKIINNSSNEAAIRRMHAEIQQRDYSMSKGVSLER